MASYDALRHVTLGHYYPGASPIHRLDPRAKLLAAGLGTVAIVVAASTGACLALALGVLALAALARLPLRHVWRILKPALPVFAVLAIFQFLFAGGLGDDTLAYAVKAPWGPVRVHVGGLLTALSSIVRLIDLVLLVGLLMSTTSASGLTHGIEML
ncbi:MAG: energy-coupling factor transporter transmembrane protein EcfT, partial [Anaerolineae bacterium]|nr:energy-coupling factor transporter transmembrane protein EcfT [Anaerolineae bacterium]